MTNEKMTEKIYGLNKAYGYENIESKGLRKLNIFGLIPKNNNIPIYVKNGLNETGVLFPLNLNM